MPPLFLSPQRVIVSCALASVLGYPFVCTADPVISEFLASNDSVAVPGASPLELEDWIEIHNPDATAVDLGGWHLTDKSSNLDKWAFPPGTTLAAGAYLVVFADGTSGIDAEGFLHADFKLSAGGEYVALTRPDESIASSFDPAGADYPEQETDVSYGISPVNGTNVYFSTPTPGAANDPLGIAQVVDTKFSVDRGFYTSSISVEITTETVGATIYVTTDSSPPLDGGGSPTSTAVAYTGPLAIATTTILRAAASAPGLAPTDADTHTYIFPSEVVSQVAPSGYPTAWGTESNPDYEVDTDISQSGTYSTRFLEGLRELPTVSLTGAVADIFGSGGIYSNTQNRNLEAAISAEYFQPSSTDGSNDIDGFQINCGLKIQGGASRLPERAIKHSLSLRFRSQYGAGKLDFPIFEEISKNQAEDSFNSIHLRAMYNNSWIHADSNQRARASMIRDQWMRDSLIAMGNRDGGFGQFVNVYINGLYWGVYNMHERLNDDHYAEYNGYEPSEVTGYNPADQDADWDALKAIVETGTWEQISQVLDVDHYIDYLIMQQFGDNDDVSTGTNWRAVGGGSASAPWKLYLWDSERTMQNPDDTTLSLTQDGANFFSFLGNFSKFRQRFADRAYKYLYHDGALTNVHNRARFLRYVTMLDVPIVGESARWGDVRKSNPYNRDQDWEEAVYGGLGTVPLDGILGDWYPDTGTNRTDIIISAWKLRNWAGSTDTWLPNADPPQFSPSHGGELLGGTQLTLTGTTGTILYTLDGSDPMDGGIVYSGGAIPMTESGVVKTRWQDGAKFSALNEAVFVVEPFAEPGELVISEIHYNPAGDNDTAFIELSNSGVQTVNLYGASFTEGVRYAFDTVQTLAPGERLVLAEDSSAFMAAYGSASDGEYSGNLDRGGERLTLTARSGATITSVRYDDSLPWPSRADGDGSSLKIASGSVYRASVLVGGTPSEAPATELGVVINEVLAHTDEPLVDAIELRNITGSSIDLSGWFLSDSLDRVRKFQIPTGTMIPAGGILVFDESEFNGAVENTITGYSGTLAVAPTTVTVSGSLPAAGTLVTISEYEGVGNYNGTYEVTVTGANTFTIPVPYLDDDSDKGHWTPGQPFKLSSEKGETVVLSKSGASEFSDSITFGASPNGESFARYSGTERVLVPASFRTLGLENTAPPRIGPVVISEVRYGSVDPFVELYNTSGSTQSLDNWTLRGKVDFDFPPGSSLAPGEVAVVAATPTTLAGTQVFGPWENGDDLLGFGGGAVRLQRADTPSPEEPAFFPQLVEDEVVFLTESPWPNPLSKSLQRISVDTPGSDPSSWMVALPNPGDVLIGTFAEFAILNNLTGIVTDDADGDGIPDLGEHALGLDPHEVDPNPLTIVPGSHPTFMINPDAVGVSVTLEASEDLESWDVPGVTVPSTLFYRLRFTGN